MVKHAELKARLLLRQDAIRGLLGVTAKAIGVACRDKKLRFSETRRQAVLSWSMVYRLAEGNQPQQPRELPKTTC